MVHVVEFQFQKKVKAETIKDDIKHKVSVKKNAFKQILLKKKGL